MKKLLLFLVPLVLAALTFCLFLFLASKGMSNKGALQVTTIPRKSKVYLNGQYYGETPLCRCEFPNTLPVGDYTIRVVPPDGSTDSFEQKISIEKSVLTVVDRTFAGTTTSDGSIISLKHLNDLSATEVFINSFPDKTQVLLDKNVAGQTPLLLKNITASDHELTLTRSGYKDKTVHIHTVAGYQLLATVFLAIDPSVMEGSSEASPSALIVPSISPSLTPSPSETPSLAPTRRVSLSPTGVPGTILILDTPTGFLHVRDNPQGEKIVGEVHPGDVFTPLDQQNSWFEIKLTDGTIGWVSGAYVKQQ